MKARTVVLGALALVAAVWIFAVAAHADGDWTYTPGTHHLSTSTADAIYAEVVKDYLAAYPGSTAPPRSPKYGFTTNVGICTIMGVADPKESQHCATAITCGEWGMCGDWPKDFDTIFDESINYETPIGKAIVYHEFWHILQYWHKGPVGYLTHGDNAMKELSCRENEAYTRNVMFLRRHNHDSETWRFLQILRQYPCQPY